MLIEVLSPDTLERIGTITRAESVQWERKYNDYGTFEIHTDQDGIRQFHILKQGENCGILLKTEETYQGVVGYGLDLNGILKARHIETKQQETADAETLIKHLVTSLMVSPADADRKIAHMVVAANQHRGKEITWECDNVNLAEEVRSLCMQGGLGYRIAVIDGELVFDVYEGEDRSAYTTFSREFRNLEEASYTMDALNSATFAYAVQDGAVVTSAGEGSGILRWETAISDTGDAALLQTKLEEALQSKRPVESIEAVANDKLVYHVDWELGDFVTVRFRDKLVKKQITQVREVYERANSKIEPIFGEQKDNIIKLLMKE